ncbi:MAG: amidohydrolase family protein [Candidatus Abyssubacteria bacterium]
MARPLILRSAYLIDENGRVFQNPEVVIHGLSIAEVRENSPRNEPSGATQIDLGRAILIPGLVNAHTHLELGLARAHIRPQSCFTDWIREVVDTARNRPPKDFSDAVRAGLRHTITAGVTSLGDICARSADWDAYAASGITVRAFHEVIDFNPQTADNSFEALKRRIREHARSGGSLVGISPHTPYTVSEKLLKRCIEFAHENDLPLCIHLAETPAETEFLLKGTGEIREFRREFGLPPGWQPPRTSPIRYLERLGLFEKPATLIHCNYVEEADFEILKRSDSSVVFCPRSHSYFGHEQHPCAKMLEFGINVALGTDSLLSCPSLSILDELRFLRRQHAGIEPDVLLKMATVNGLKALSLAPKADLLECGSPADLVAVRALQEGDHTPLETVFSEKAEIVFCMTKGKIIFEKRSPFN